METGTPHIGTGVEPHIALLLRLYKIVDGDGKHFKAPLPGGRLQVRLLATDNREVFFLDVHEGARSSSLGLGVYADTRKTKLQNRHANEPLVRIDIDEHAKHTNPDGTIIRGSHVHVATKEFGDRIAYPLDGQDLLPGLVGCDGVEAAFDELLRICNIEDGLRIDWNLGL